MQKKKKKKIVIDRGYATTSVPSLVKEKEKTKLDSVDTDDTTSHVTPASSPPVSPSRFLSPCQSPLAQALELEPAAPAQSATAAPSVEINKEYKTAHLPQPKVVLSETQRSVVSLPRNLEKALIQLLECPRPPVLLPTAASMRVLNAVYLHLIYLGFSVPHVEKALSAVVDISAKTAPDVVNEIAGLTEAYVDTCMAWLCLNIPHNDLPPHWTDGKLGEQQDEGNLTGLSSPRGNSAASTPHNLSSPRGPAFGASIHHYNIASPHNHNSSSGLSSPRGNGNNNINSPRGHIRHSSLSSPRGNSTSNFVSAFPSAAPPPPSTQLPSKASKPTSSSSSVPASSAALPFSPTARAPTEPLDHTAKRRANNNMSLDRPDAAIKERIQLWQDSDDADGPERDLSQELGSVKLTEVQKQGVQHNAPQNLDTSNTVTININNNTQSSKGIEHPKHNDASPTKASVIKGKLQQLTSPSPPLSPSFAIASPLSLSTSSSPLATPFLPPSSSTSTASLSSSPTHPLILPAPLVLSSSHGTIASPRAVSSFSNPSSPISPPTLTPEGFELDFDLFEKKDGVKDDNKPLAPPHPLASRKPTQDFSYNKKWSGLSPWVRLKQQCQKDKSLGKVEIIPIAPECSYHQLSLRIHHHGNASVAYAFDMEPNECTYSREEAENVVATKALYVLNAGTSLYQQLPPPFRALWLNWIQQEKDQKDQLVKEAEAVEHAEHLRRLTFVYSLLQAQQARNADEGKRKVCYSLPPLNQLLANPFGPLSQHTRTNSTTIEDEDSANTCSSGSSSSSSSSSSDSNNSSNSSSSSSSSSGISSSSSSNSSVSQKSDVDSNSNNNNDNNHNNGPSSTRGSSTDGWDNDGEVEEVPQNTSGWEQLVEEQEQAERVAALQEEQENARLHSRSNSTNNNNNNNNFGHHRVMSTGSETEDMIHRRLEELLSPHQLSSALSSGMPVQEEYAMYSEDLAFRERLDVYEEEAKTQDYAEIQCQDADSEVLREMFYHVQTGPEYQRILVERMQLPIFQHRESILRALHSNDVALIAGETGSGKTTQVPQYILEDMMQSGCGASCNIIVTQPRRISAQGVASRVAAELGQTCGELCGYQIKMESRKSPATRILYCTTGILLRRLQTDRFLEGVSHVIIDEVHERTLHSDFLMVLLRRILELRRQQGPSSTGGQLQLVLMSATMDAESLQRYYVNAGFTCPALSISGRTFPVEEFFLDEVLALASSGASQNSLTQSTEEWPDEKINFNLIEDLLVFLDQQRPDRPEHRDRTDNANWRFGVEGAVLIFMSGLKDIDRLNQRLQGSRIFGDPNRYRIYTLHSSLAGSGPGVFAVPPRGVRKIVIATNIAETGITIPDVVFVIDMGRMKQVRYNSRTKLSSLKEIYVARANATQRAGRAGRVQPGFCFRFYTKELYATLPQNWQPEMLRMPLEELCLHILDTDLGESPCALLAGALSPPSPARVLDALATLEQVGAVRKVVLKRTGPVKKRVDEDVDDGVGGRSGEVEYHLTSLGRVLAQLPVDVQIARMAVFGALLRCLEPILVIAAASTCTKPLFKGGNGVDAALLPIHVRHNHSDHLVVYHAYRAWRKACEESGKPSVLTRGGGVSHAFCMTFNPPIHEASILELQAVKLQLCELLLDAGFGAEDRGKINQAYDSPMSLNVHSNNLSVIRAALAAGLYPRVACVQAAGRDQNGEPIAMYTETRHHKRLYVHPSSLNFQYNLRASSSSASSTATTPRKPAGPPTPSSSAPRYLSGNWMVYMEKIQTARVFIRDTSVVGALPLLLLCGSPSSAPSSLRVLPLSRVIVLDNWMEVSVAPKTAVLIKLLGQELQHLMLQQVRLQHSSTSGLSLPSVSTGISSPRRINAIMNIVVAALACQTH